jgi:hypothetical protein
MVDGDARTSFKRKGRSYYGTLIDLDLGRPFGVNLIRFFPSLGNHDFLRRYALYISPGTPESIDPFGQPIYTTVAEDAANDQDTVVVHLNNQYVRFIRLKALSTIEFEIAEIEVFGSGFQPVAVYTSEPIDLKHIATWGQIEWSQAKTGLAGNSDLIIRTRSGNDETPVIYTRKLLEGWTGRLLGLVPWKKGAKAGLSVNLPDPATGKIVNIFKGDELDSYPVDEAMLFYQWLPKASRDSLALTREEYEPLSDRERGTTVVDTENWSPWQPATNRAPILSPGERRFFQFQVEIRSTALDAATGVGSLRFEYSTATAVHRVVAEIAPALGVTIGEPINFTYALRPMIKEDDTGFNRIEIQTPSRALSIGSTLATPGGTGSIEVGGKVVECRVESVEDKRFIISLPKVTVEQDSVLITIPFQAAVLGFGTTFAGRVFIDADDDGRPDELPQWVIAGDVTNLGEGDANRLSVEVTFQEQSLVNSVSVSPNSFTPNGDGRNDRVEITYEILQLTRAVPVSVKVYTTVGMLVKTIYIGTGAMGKYFRYWDGTDEQGNVVPPGIYLVRVVVEAGTGAVEETRSVGVVY